MGKIFRGDKSPLNKKKYIYIGKMFVFHLSCQQCKVSPSVLLNVEDFLFGNSEFSLESLDYLLLLDTMIC